MMGTTSLKITNHATAELMVDVVKQGPKHAYDADFKVKSRSVSAGVKTEVLEVSRGIGSHWGSTIDTTEVQLNIDGNFIGAIVIMLDSRTEPLKSEIYWAIRGASGHISAFKDDHECLSVSYRTSRYDVTITIAGESHGIGLDDIIVDVTATALEVTTDITVDLKLGTDDSEQFQYTLSIVNGYFYVLTDGKPSSERQEEITFPGGKPVRLKASYRHGAKLRVSSGSRKVFEVPLDGIDNEPLNITLQAEYPKLKSGVVVAEQNIPVIITADVTSKLPSDPQSLEKIFSSGRPEGGIDLNDPKLRQWVIDSFGGTLAYLAEQKQYIWHGFNIWNTREVVRANIRVGNNGRIRIYFSGFHHGNPVYTQGGFGPGNHRFLALMNGAGTLEGTIAAIKAGLIPDKVSGLVLLASTYNEWNQEADADLWSLAQKSGKAVVKYEISNAVSVALASTFIRSIITTAPQEARRQPVLFIMAVQVGIQTVVGIVLDSFF